MSGKSHQFSKRTTLKKCLLRSSCRCSAEVNLTSVMRIPGQSLASLSESRIWRCRELCCRSQTRLGSCMAVAVAEASSYSSDLTPSLRTSICCSAGLKTTTATTTKQKTKNKRQKIDDEISTCLILFLLTPVFSLFSFSLSNLSYFYNCPPIFPLNLAG